MILCEWPPAQFLGEGLLVDSFVEPIHEKPYITKWDYILYLAWWKAKKTLNPIVVENIVEILLETYLW